MEISFISIAVSVSVEVDHVERDMERLKVTTSDIQESKG